MPIDRLRFNSCSRHRRLRPSNKLKDLSNVFQSTDIHNKRYQISERVKPAIDHRLNRFRMLDPHEFREMLSSLSQQQSKEHNSIDKIGGMQLEGKNIAQLVLINYYKRCSFFCLDYWP